MIYVYDVVAVVCLCLDLLPVVKSYYEWRQLRKVSTSSNLYFFFFSLPISHIGNNVWFECGESKNIS